MGNDPFESRPVIDAEATTPTPLRGLSDYGMSMYRTAHATRSALQGVVQASCRTESMIVNPENETYDIIAGRVVKASVTGTAALMSFDLFAGLRTGDSKTTLIVEPSVTSTARAITLGALR
jgi:hypothetical protein